MRYNLDHTQVEYAKANSELFRHIEVIYTDIVKPMELALKRLAIRLNVCSEAELFASNLQYRVFQRDKEAPEQLRRGCKEDEIKKLTTGMTQIIDNFTEVFEGIYR